MGYSLVPYAIDIDALRAKVLAHDGAYFERLATDRADDLEGYDEEIEEYWDEEETSGGGGLVGALKGLFGKKQPAPGPTEAPEMPSGEDCLRSILMGGPKYGSIAHVYAYMFEWICSDLGEDVDAGSFSGMRSGSGWMGSVDKALQKQGIASDVFSLEYLLTNRGAPIDLPQPDDFPAMGYITHAELSAALPLLKAIDPASFSAATSYPEEGPNALATCIRMAETAVNSGRGLVGFYY